MANKKILVTGATGFVGKHLVKDLKACGYDVVEFSASQGKNVTNPDDFQTFNSSEIATVIHLAGKTFVPKSWEIPHEFYKTNTLGTQNVLDFCRKNGANLVYISAYVYGIPQYLPIDEKHPVNPNNPYAHSKFLAEELCRFYSEKFGVKSVILRPFNLYGKGQDENFLIPSLVRQLKENSEIIVKDDTPKRDYLHVSDFTNACIKALKYDKPFGVFNVGSGKSFSVREVVELLVKISGKDVKYTSLGEKRPNEIPDTIADCTLLAEELGWKPEISLEKGLKTLF